MIPEPGGSGTKPRNAAARRRRRVPLPAGRRGSLGDELPVIPLGSDAGWRWRRSRRGRRGGCGRRRGRLCRRRTGSGVRSRRRGAGVARSRGDRPGAARAGAGPDKPGPASIHRPSREYSCRKPASRSSHRECRCSRQGSPQPGSSYCCTTSCGGRDHRTGSNHARRPSHRRSSHRHSSHRRSSRHRSSHRHSSRRPSRRHSRPPP